MISFEPRVAIIDDKFEEINGILKQYQDEGVGIKYFNAHLTNPDPKPTIHFSDLNLIFLDVHFTENTDDYDPTLCAAWIDSLLPENSFYILVLWSKETDKKDEILEELKLIKKEPFLFFAEQKTDYQTKEGWDFQKLREAIDLKLTDYPELEELTNWKKNVAVSSNLVIGHLINNSSPDTLKRKLQKIILGHGGKSLLQSQNNNFKREILFEALDSVLISNTKGLIPFKKISEVNNKGIYQIPENVQADVDSKLNSWFHFKLHKTPLNQEVIKPGTICTFKNNLLKEYYNIQNDEYIQKYLSHQILKKDLPDSKCTLIDICLLISRPCDVAQNKYGKNLKLISGVLINNPSRKGNAKKEFKKGNSNLISVKLYDHLQLSEKDIDIALIFDYRYVFSVPEKMFIDKFEKIKVFNKELLSEIQVEYSAYSSRLGITQIL